MVRDPVCGMTVDPGASKYSSDYQHHHYYFCSPVCKEKFDAHPVSYLSKKGILARFLTWITKGNEKVYPRNPPNCCSK